MLPYLTELSLGSTHYRLPSYGVLLALAFSLGYFKALKRAKSLGEDPRHIENLFLLVVLGSVIGSRLFHVLFEDFDYYLQHPFKVFALWEGGYTFYGAVLTGLLFMVMYAKAKKLDFLQFADMAAESTSLGLAPGRLGCFLAGCCWGKATSVPWAVTFTHPSAFVPVKNVPLHPTQLYESLGSLLIFFYIEWLFKRRRYPGEVLFHALMAYAVLRFSIEFTRGDDYRGFVLGGLMSYSQLISVLFFVIGAVGVFRKNRALARRRRERGL